MRRGKHWLSLVGDDFESGWKGFEFGWWWKSLLNCEISSPGPKTFLLDADEARAIVSLKGLRRDIVRLHLPPEGGATDAERIGHLGDMAF